MVGSEHDQGVLCQAGFTQSLQQVTHAFVQCGSDGNVHWVDSCGEEGEIASDCGVYACVDTSANTAQCELTPCTSDPVCASLGLICNLAWGVCVVSSCTGLDDFTPRAVKTSELRGAHATGVS